MGLCHFSRLQVGLIGAGSVLLAGGVGAIARRRDAAGYGLWLGAAFCGVGAIAAGNVDRVRADTRAAADRIEAAVDRHLRFLMALELRHLDQGAGADAAGEPAALN